MFCSNCGTRLNDNAAFCTNCGASQNTTAPSEPINQVPVYSAPVKQEYTQQAPVYVPPVPQPHFHTGNGKKSYYDGSVLDTFVNALVVELMIMFSCGIAIPWAVTYMWKFILSHVVINGKRLVFTGNGTDLFGKWIVWFLLTGITCGIYGFWVMPKMYDWIASNTHFVE